MPSLISAGVGVSAHQCHRCKYLSKKKHEEMRSHVTLFLVRSFFYTKGLPWTTQPKFHTSENLNRKCPLATTGSQDDGLSISEGVTLWGMIQNVFHQIRYNFITVYTPRAKSSFKIQNKKSIDIVVTSRLMKKMQICQTQVCRKTILISLTVFSVRISLVLKKNAF